MVSKSKPIRAKPKPKPKSKPGKVTKLLERAEKKLQKIKKGNKNNLVTKSNLKANAANAVLKPFLF